MTPTYFDNSDLGKSDSPVPATSQDSRSCDPAPARYAHDCSRCHYVGRFANLDLYTCGPSVWPVSTSYIARFGSDGPEYASMEDFGGKVRDGIAREIGGLSDEQLTLLVFSRLLPAAFILNTFTRSNRPDNNRVDTLDYDENVKAMRETAEETGVSQAVAYVHRLLGFPTLTQSEAKSIADRLKEIQ